jgi:hypothetical protein
MWNTNPAYVPRALIGINRKHLEFTWVAHRLSRKYKKGIGSVCATAKIWEVNSFFGVSAPT